MENPYAPPNAEEPGIDSEYPRPTRHWFWKVYAVLFAIEVLADILVFLSGEVSLQAVVYQSIHVLAGVGVFAYAFSKRLRRRWIWEHIWWAFPLTVFIAHLTERAAGQRLLEAHSNGNAISFVSFALLFAPLCSLALFRFARSPILT